METKTRASRRYRYSQHPSNQGLKGHAERNRQQPRDARELHNTFTHQEQTFSSVHTEQQVVTNAVFEQQQYTSIPQAIYHQGHNFNHDGIGRTVYGFENDRESSEVGYTNINAASGATASATRATFMDSYSDRE
ncbi:hypothetical protein B0T12DRAFT_400160 [Alternaria alternata]|nr:hypothetical protein B0T12DRAFT_400160 [Alternaria alternata]